MTREDIKKEIELRYDENLSEQYNNGYSIGFEDGAEWRINSIWHENDITPGYDCHVLIEDIYGNVYDDKYYADYNEYESAIEQKEIKRWAYIKDLLPTKQEN